MKNIILIILALTNLFLLIFVLSQALQNSRMREQVRENSIAFLRDRGVQVDETLIPQTVDLLPQVVERDLEAEEAIAGALLRGEVQVETRGGEVYRYFNGNGSLQCHSDGTFSAQLAPASFPLEGERAEACRSVLELLGFQGELVEEQGDQLTFRQTWEGVPLFSQQVTLICAENGLEEMTNGRRLVGQPVEDPARRPITVATALIEFFNGVSALGDVYNRIDSIEQGYVSAASLSGPMTLTPVWRVTTDTGAYQLDMVTGAVSRISGT